MEYNDMVSGPATRINTAALDLEFAERRVAASANKLLRQVTRNQFSGFKVMLRQCKALRIRWIQSQKPNPTLSF